MISLPHTTDRDSLSQSSPGTSPTVLTLRWRQPLTKPRAKKPRKKNIKPASKEKTREDEAATDLKTVVLGDPPPLMTGCKSTYRTAQWWFCMPEHDTTKYQAARRHWVDAGWAITNKSRHFHECISLYTMRKIADLSGQTDAYVAQKGRVIHHINSRLSDSQETKQPAALTLVAIGILAYCSLLDQEFEAARVHLTALQSVQASRRFEDAKEEWLYVLWVDLRYALIHGTVPLLDYCVPKAYRDSLNLDMSHLWPRANAAMKISPVCIRTGTLSDADMFDLWIRLFQLCDLCKRWQYEDTPAFGLLYDVEYRLRVMHCRLLQMQRSSLETERDNAVCLQLVLSAIQMTTWIFTRFWAPASPGSRRFLAAQTKTLIRGYTAAELQSRWSTSSGSSATLQWVLATIAVFAAQDGIDPEPVAMEVLREMSTDQDTFINQMQEWPWADDWHRGKFQALWEHISDLHKDGATLSSSIRLKGPKHFYLGAVEFYQD